MYQVDLSRFACHTIKSAKLADLMRVREFRDRVNAYHGEISDEWVLTVVRELESMLYIDYATAQRLEQRYGEQSAQRRVWKYRMIHKARKSIERGLQDAGKSELS